MSYFLLQFVFYSPWRFFSTFLSHASYPTSILLIKNKKMTQVYDFFGKRHKFSTSDSSTYNSLTIASSVIMEYRRLLVPPSSRTFTSIPIDFVKIPDGSAKIVTWTQWQSQFIRKKLRCNIFCRYSCEYPKSNWHHFGFIRFWKYNSLRKKGKTFKIFQTFSMQIFAKHHLNVNK